MKKWKIGSVEEWRDVATDVAAMLHPGDVLTLQGVLGAGKTTFVQALAAAMGAKKTPKSPTFSMLRTYTVRHGDIRRLLHVDAYRIDDERDMVPLDLDDELSEGDAILVLEWPENVQKWLKGRSSVKLFQSTIIPEGRKAVMTSRA